LCTSPYSSFHSPPGGTNGILVVSNFFR
jgi:hypothetical protein